MLTSGGNRFDGNPDDYGIVTEAVLAVLAAKPNSNVSVFRKSDVALTAFASTDRAFRALAKDFTGESAHSEKKMFDRLVAALGVDTIEQRGAPARGVPRRGTPDHHRGSGEPPRPQRASAVAAAAVAQET